jgi:hypothetical protein
MSLLKPIPTTLLIMFFPALVSFFGLFGENSLFCTGPTTQGANVDHALALAALGALVLGVLVVIVVIAPVNWWRWRALIAGACVLEAAAVGLAIGFLALDSATYVSTERGFFGGSDSSVGHLGMLYYAWAFCIGALLNQAVRLLRLPPPEPPASRYEQPSWLQELPAGCH